jgi:eukaryotic-like serine/threonine-protein kinase
MRSGTTISGRFEVERKASSGGMGTVYVGRDRLTGQRVAVKLLTSEGPSAAERFLREGSILAEITHPWVVRYVAHGTTDAGEHYLAMEWLEGEDLANRLARGPLSAHQAVTLASRVARGLSALHARGIVHRDIKPSNVFLEEGSVERPKILDFGIARPMPEDSRVTRTGATLGTPGYMAPEQARGDRELDARSDVFALGCVLFECLTGRPPFVGEHAIAVLARILLEPAIPPSELCPGIPRALDDLVLEMLCKDASGRPPDAAAVDARLSSIGDVPRDAPVGASAVNSSTRALTESEQRMISIVLGGRIESRTLLPEEDADVERGVAEIAHMRGAQLETLADGSILAAFAGEGAATDRAAKAARATLRLRELLPGTPFAIATGRVLVSPGANTPLFIGDAVDRAAQALVRSSGISIDATTAQLLDARFDVRGAGDVRELVGERLFGDETRTVLGRHTSCVGRERELAILSAVLDEAHGDSVARGALLVGPAGIGKSRIRQEFLRRVERQEQAVTVWLARADPVGKGSPFGLVAQAIRLAVGIFEGEPLLLRHAKLAAAVARNVVGKADRARVVQFLAELVGSPFPDAEAPRLRAARGDATLMGDEMRRAFEDFLAGECAHKPLLFVLEDLHWGDRPTVLWIDAALRNLRDKPLMVLALARPEVFELFPRLWHDRAITEIGIGELSRKASEKLVREVLGAAAKGAAVARVVDQAAGNPFYLEELIRAAAQGESGILPQTVLAMVHARLSALDADARRVLRAASVFGQVFWKGGLEALLGGSMRTDLDAWLALLVAREFIERRTQAKFPDEEEYAFRHDLVREASYSMLTQEDRRAGHKLAGKWLEKAGENDAMILAEHFELGGSRRSALQYVRRAAEHALEGNDFDAVLARVERGIQIGASGEMLGMMRILAAEAWRWRGEFGESSQAATEALALLPKGSAPWCMAAREVAFAFGRLGRVEELKRMADELRAAGPPASAAAAFAFALSRVASCLLQAGVPRVPEELVSEMARVASSLPERDARVEGLLHGIRGAMLLANADPAGLLESTLAAIACFEEAGDFRNACLGRANAGYAAIELGQTELAETLLRQAWAEAERMGLSAALAIKENLGKLLVILGKTDEAAKVLEDAIEHLRANKHMRAEGICRSYRATLLERLGRIDEAEAEARHAVALLEMNPHLRAAALGGLSRALLLQGKRHEALEAAVQANQIRESFGGALEEGDALVRLVHAEALAANGHAAAAQTAIAQAEEKLLERARRIGRPAWRQSFLENVEENRRTLELAKSLLETSPSSSDKGRRAEG